MATVELMADDARNACHHMYSRIIGGSLASHVGSICMDALGAGHRLSASSMGVIPGESK